MNCKPPVEPEGDSVDRTAYQTWKWSTGAIPWRLPLGGFAALAALALLLVIAFDQVGATYYRWTIAGFGAFLFAGAITLIYDIPQKRLSRFSRGVLVVSLLGPIVLAVVAILTKD